MNVQPRSIVVFAITDPPISGGAGGVRGGTGCTCWFGSFGEGDVHLREPRNGTTSPRSAATSNLAIIRKADTKLIQSWRGAVVKSMFLLA